AGSAKTRTNRIRANEDAKVKAPPATRARKSMAFPRADGLTASPTLMTGAVTPRRGARGIIQQDQRRISSAAGEGKRCPRSVVPAQFAVKGARIADKAAGALGNREILDICDVLHADLGVPVRAVIAEHRVDDGRIRDPGGIGSAGVSFAVVGQTGTDTEAAHARDGEIVGRPNIEDVSRYANRRVPNLRRR